MLELSQRRLLKSGVSIVVLEEAQRRIIETGSVPPHIKVERSPDAETYELLYHESIIFDGSEESLSPKYDYPVEQQEAVIDFLYENKRDNVSDEEHTKRLASELVFFVEYGKVDFLCSLKELIESFRKDGVVWGVGRGSSCASYVLYLLGVHDINPIKYEIDFKEFSKWEEHD